MKKALLIIVVILVLLAAVGLWLYHPDLPLDYLKSKYAGGESRFMEVAGMQVHYRDQGQGPTLVLLHGTASSLHTWDGWAGHLADRFRVVRLDLPGFGLTGPSPAGDYRINAYVSLVTAFLDKLGITSCHLAGNSLGGRIAWNLAWQHPGRVKKLILIDPSGMPWTGPLPLAIRLARLPLLGGLLKYVAVRSLVADSVRQVYGDPTKVSDALVQRYYELMLRPGNRAAFAQRAALVVQGDTGGLKRIQAPTLIMWGEADAWIPVSDAAKFTQLIPKARVIIYPGVGHVPMEEIPERTAADAQRFLLE